MISIVFPKLNQTAENFFCYITLRQRFLFVSCSFNHAFQVHVVYSTKQGDSGEFRTFRKEHGRGRGLSKELSHYTPAKN